MTAPIAASPAPHRGCGGVHRRRVDPIAGLRAQGHREPQIAVFGIVHDLANRTEKPIQDRAHPGIGGANMLVGHRPRPTGDLERIRTLELEQIFQMSIKYFRSTTFALRRNGLIINHVLW